MRLTPEIRNAASSLASHGNKQRWAKVSAKERSSQMRDLRMKAIAKIAARLKRERPKSSQAWQVGNAAFLAENEANKKGRN